jgi:predicted secreted acid phosphatase
MDKICIVFDIDETLLHYTPEPKPMTTPFDSERNILEDGDIALFRPGLREFIEYVKSKNGKILLGIWTYGTKEYAKAIVKTIEEKYNDQKKLFEFVYSREV